MSDLPTRLRDAFAGRYRFERELGRGGMGTVYLMRDLKHDRWVAVKVLRPEVAAALGAERFLREIRVTAQLQHPHILPLFDSGEADGVLYYIMPYVEGETLRDRMRRELRLELGEVIEIAKAVASALDHAHRHGIVHRDVKPENVLLGTGVPTLSDFGIAKAAEATTDQVTQAGYSLGTPVYMSPEQAAGDPEVDGRTDIYSLGVMLFEMLAGRPPFEAANPMALTARKLTEAAPRLRAWCDVPPLVEAVISKALAMAPEERFPTAADLAKALTGAAPVGPLPSETGSRAVAVMPFANVSADPGDEFLSDGIADELIHVLSEIEGLRVVARTSSFAFKGKAVDARTIGERLGVGVLLEGSVRRAGRRLRIGAQLVSAADGIQLWSARYDRECDDVFAIQDEIARSVATALEGRLLGRAAPVVQFEAYELYLRGLQAWNRRSEEALAESVVWLEQAIVKEPRFALAHSALANAFVIRGLYGFHRPAEAMAEAERSGRAALAIAPDLPEALAALACVQTAFQWDWTAGEAAFRAAIRRQPTYATARQWYAMNCLVPLGRFPEARLELTLAREHDPLSPAMAISGALVAYFERDFERAVAEYRQVLAAEPAFGMAHQFLGEVLVQMGRVDEALDVLRKAAALTGQSSEALATLAQAEAEAGHRPEALRLLGSLEARAQRRYVSPALIARIHLGLGDLDAAVEWLERAVPDRSPYLTWLAVRPLYDPLRASPRFAALIRKVGLPG